MLDMEDKIDVISKKIDEISEELHILKEANKCSDKKMKKVIEDMEAAKNRGY